MNTVGKLIMTAMLISLTLGATACESQSFDYTRVRPESREWVDSKIADYNERVGKVFELDCDHDYKAMGISSLDIFRYNDDLHKLSCPLCHEVLEYEPHYEKSQGVSSGALSMSDGTKCDVITSICECRSHYQVIIRKSQS